MRAKSLVSFILLSSLVILLLSTATQATEYKEVKADDILKQIENDEDINLTDCRIVGVLTVSKIKLETVSNPNFCKLLNEEFDKEELIELGCTENLHVIKSNITIKNCIFENNVDFSNILFNSSTDFSWANFNDSADFSYANFNNSTNFSYVNFNNLVDFTETDFNDYTDFSYAKFNNYAFFTETDFNDSADFTKTDFNDSVDFEGMKIFNYTEIKAEEILKQIENSEDVNLVNHRIIGDLNINNIKLETIPNSYFYECQMKNNMKDISFPGDFYHIYVENPFSKESPFSRDSHENSIVIESNITIINSIFEDNVDFSNVLFNNSADFSYVDFSDSADFSWMNFDDSADFSWTNFDDSADFSWTNFNDSADFYDTNFNNPADFSKADFNSSTDFSWTNFNDPADFSWTNFNDSADFSSANFNDSADFSYVNFNGPTNFFWTNFNGSADFFWTNFGDSADFYGTNFNDSTDFYGTNFNDSADFFRAKFLDSTDFSNANFNNFAGFRGPDTAENILTNGKNCEFFRNWYRNEARYIDADNIYYNYRKYALANEELTPSSKLIDVLSLVTCGYGLKPLRPLAWGVFFVIFFTIVYKNPGMSLNRNENQKILHIFYWKTPGIYRSSNISEKKSTLSVWDALYFSISTFTTVGSGDLYPRDNFRKWVTLEGVFGWLLLGIFMATLANIMIRS